MRTLRFVILSLCLLSQTTLGADTFYLLTRSGPIGNYQYSVKCYAPNGVLLKQLDMPSSWDEPSDCSAVASDGTGVWVAHSYDRNYIHVFDFWSAASGGGAAYQTTDHPTYGYGKGLAIQSGTLYLVRDHLDANTDRVERYSSSGGAYLGQWKTNPESYHPFSAQATPTTLYVLDGGGSGVVAYDRTNGDYWGSISVSGAGPLCGNASTLWILSTDQITWWAYSTAGGRQASLDVTLTGTGTIRDAYMAPGPDITPSTNSLDFGIIQVGSSNTLSFSVENRGTSTLTLNSLTFPNSEVTSPTTFPISLSAGQQTTIQVTYTPTAGSSLSDALVINSTDPKAPQFSINLSGMSARTRFFVVEGNLNAGNGQSWYSAFASMNDALASPLVLGNSEIWVKKGTYNLTGKLEVDRVLSIYGGFLGTETNLSQRNIESNPTIIDGGSTDFCFEISTNATVDGFTVQNAGPTSGYGGAFTLSGGTANIQNCLIRNNEAYLSGSALYADSNVDSVTLHNCDITGNSGYNTTVISSYYTKELIVQNCNIYSNAPGLSEADGGGIYCRNAETLIVSNCLISGHSNVRRGGGICASDVGNVQIEDTVIKDNIATNRVDSSGGGICILNFSRNPIIKILNSTVNNNISVSASGIQASGNDVLVSGCVISNNSATVESWSLNGGASLSSTTNIIVRDTIICNNQSSTSGGGLDLNAGSHINLEKVISKGNQCTTDGGGLRLYASSIGMTNCLVSSNTAGTQGGGVRAYSQTGVQIVNCTIANNMHSGSGLGVGLYAYGSGWVNIYNSIIWGSRDSGSVRDGLQLYGSSGKTVEYSNVEDSYFGSRPTCTNTNPLFVNSASNNYQLSASSPCIDLGDSADPRAPGSDLLSIFRPQDGDVNGTSTHDMGCYEYVLDGDGDGMNDEWEALHGVDDPNDDPDNDGHTNYEEYICDTNPNIPDALKLTTTDMLTHEMVINWLSSTACQYTVKLAPALDVSWTNHTGWEDVSGTGTNMTCNVPTSPTNGFIRLQVIRSTP